MNKPELIIALQAIAASKDIDLSWLDVNVVFAWREQQYRISQNGERYWRLNQQSKEWKKPGNEHGLINMFRNVGEIKPIPCYTTTEAEQAKKDMACSAGFEWVSKEPNGETHLWTVEPVRTEDYDGWHVISGDRACSHESIYPSLKPNTKERLEVIAGYGD